MSTETPNPAATDSTNAAVPDAAPATPAVPQPNADATAATNPAGDAPVQSDPKPADDAGKGKGGDEAPVVPEVYAAPEMPEGIVFDEGLAQALTPILREQGVTQEVFNKMAAGFAQYQASQMATLDKQWLDATVADAELSANDGHLKRAAVAAFAKFGTPELKEAMNAYRWGNHPELVRAFGKLGLAAKVLEDRGTDSAASGSGPRTHADVLFGK